MIIKRDVNKPKMFNPNKNKNGDNNKTINYAKRAIHRIYLPLLVQSVAGSILQIEPLITVWLLLVQSCRLNISLLYGSGRKFVGWATHNSPTSFEFCWAR
jgi:hypothetical protein